MKRIKLATLALFTPMAILPIITVTSCGNILVKTIKIIVPATTLGYNQKISCSVQVTPTNATNKEVTWAITSGENLATITPAGVLTTKTTEGTLTLKATTKDGSNISDEITINILDVKVTDIKVRATPFKANINSEINCSAIVTPTYATNKDVTWSITSGSSYATIDQTGKVKINGNASSGQIITVQAASQDGSLITSTANITIDNTEDTQDYETYIHDRSFSLLGVGGGKLCWGTGWVLSDATPNNYDDYEYYIATNWHVVLGHQSLGSSCKMYFGDNKKTSGLKVLDDFTQFSSYTLENESDFYYTSRTDAIDFYVAKANFSSASSTVKSKLNKLNTRQKERGAITEFAPSTTDSQQYLCDTMYTGGFPVKNKYYATWEKHAITSSEADWKYYSSKIHEIDDYGAYKDTSPQYVMQNDMGTSFMTGGASGSMLVGKIDGQYKVCGIYWGGWTNSSKTVFYPSYSIFNSSRKNFISKYL